MKFLPLAYLFFGLSHSQKIRDLFHTKGGTLVSLYPDDCSYPCHHASNHKVGFTMTVDVDGTCLEKLDLDAELSSFFREEPCFPKTVKTCSYCITKSRKLLELKKVCTYKSPKRCRELKDRMNGKCKKGTKVRNK